MFSSSLGDKTCEYQDLLIFSFETRRGKMCLIFRRDILPEGLEEASEIVDEELGPVENGPIPTLSHVESHEIRRDSFVFGDLMT